MRNVSLIILLMVFTLSACKEEAKPGTGEIEFIDDALSAIINKDAKIEIITEGFDWSEGPLWVEQHKMLLFSDVPKNIIYKWTEAKGKEIYLQPSGYTSDEKRGGEIGSNGLTLSPEGK